MGWLSNLIEERYFVIKGIKKYGGGFMKALAEAMAHADGDNLLRIKNTWYPDWKKYLKWGKGDFNADSKKNINNDKKDS